MPCLFATPLQLHMENKWHRIKKELGLENTGTEMTPEALAGEVGGHQGSHVCLHEECLLPRPEQCCKTHASWLGNDASLSAAGMLQTPGSCIQPTCLSECLLSTCCRWRMRMMMRTTRARVSDCVYPCCQFNMCADLFFDSSASRDFKNS
jgi:hypothetical protein